jgi:hypothetical protein
VIYAGSEMSSLEPMIKKWARKEGHHLVINYKGSIMVSPIVIYCPDKVVDILIEIGLPQIPGSIKILSTDPSHSNSGNIFYGLLANVLHGDVVSTATIDNVLPGIKGYYDRMGFQPKSSGDIFDLFISNPYTCPLLNEINARVEAIENLKTVKSDMETALREAAS